MKRVNITTLTIGLVSLVILMIATMVAQCMSGKEGFAGQGIPARFFKGGTMGANGIPQYILDENAKTDKNFPLFNVSAPQKAENESDEQFYTRTIGMEGGFGQFSFASYDMEDKQWVGLSYEDNGITHPSEGRFNIHSDLLTTGFHFDDNLLENWDRSSPLRVMLDYTRLEGNNEYKKYSSTYYYHNGEFTYEWNPSSQDMGPMGGMHGGMGEAHHYPPMGGYGMGEAHHYPPMGGYGMGEAHHYSMGGPGMGEDHHYPMGEDHHSPEMKGPKGRRPIIINVTNTGGAYAPMEQHPMGHHGHHGDHGHYTHPSRDVNITHELSENAEKKLTKTMNFMEFVVKKSQS